MNGGRYSLRFPDAIVIVTALSLIGAFFVW